MALTTPWRDPEALATLGLKMIEVVKIVELSVRKRLAALGEPFLPGWKEWAKTKMAPFEEEQAAVPKAPPLPLLPEKGGGDVPKVCQRSAS